jgi:hypothetical protein
MPWPIWVQFPNALNQDNHHYANPQCGSPFYSTASSPYDPTRIGFQGEFGGIGHNVSLNQYLPRVYPHPTNDIY